MFGRALRSSVFQLQRGLLRCEGMSEQATNFPLKEKSVNQVTLLGRVGQDPQLRGGIGTRSVTVFSMATNERWQGEDGPMEKTTWHRIAVFQPGLRDLALQYIRKGHRVYLTGKIDTTMYEGQRITSVIADSIIFLSKEGARDDTEEQDDM
ncbi:PREDICTED: single-stranded DNA-binding protein, mitochondrial-like [Branchiostoma belcheri]|uniref:Single-stranded DNA-binding protein, mitochondrial-like n=1 Tax=Branchiostoma belcheri TaxID=7741 RepID=A0A6P4YG59_BRABE|nr:PREDICTED: single-stranded DNA-binding protein, mitochondrial-like [Branchiostoma belcheri]